MSAQPKAGMDKAPQWRILVVENDTGTRMDHVLNLRRWGYSVFAAAGEGQTLIHSACDLARQERCHLALVDMRLLSDNDRDDISGLNLAPKLKPTETIIVTAYADKPVYARMAEEKGVLAVVGKEEGPEILGKLIQEVLQKCGYREKVHIEWPPEYQSARVARHIFPINPALFFEEAENVLLRLFPEAHRLVVKILDSTESTPSLTLRPRSLVIQVKQDTHNLSHLVKIGRGRRTAQEADNFHRIRLDFGYNPPGAPQQPPEILWSLGGSVYSFAGDHVLLKPELFSIWHANQNFSDIRAALENLYVFWAPLYQQRTSEEIPLLDAYCRVWGQEWLGKVPTMTDLLLRIPYPAPFEKLGLPDPISWFINELEISAIDNVVYYRNSKTPLTNTAPTHGDLHGDNFFVTKDKQVWVIDYERTGIGPILQDWVELENDVLTRLLTLPSGGWEEYGQLICATTAPREVQNWVRVKHGATQTAKIHIARKGIRITDHNVYKTLEIIDQIRHLAKRCDPSATVDARQYLWGLFLNTIFRLMIWWEDYLEIASDQPANTIEQEQWDTRKHKLEHGIQRCLILAGILCCRLKNWGTPEEQWPPQEWIDIFRAESKSGSRKLPETSPTLHLQLTDQRNSQQEFMVRVLDLPNQQPHATSSLPYGPEALVAIMKLLQFGKYTPDRFDATQAAALRQLGLLNGDALSDDWADRIGSQLFVALLPADNGVRSAFENKFYPGRHGRNLKLSFDEDAAALACYPWEMIYDGFPEYPRAEVEVVRYVASGRPAQELEVPDHEKPCCLLYVSARPTALHPLQSDQDVVQNHLAAVSTHPFRFEKLDGHTHPILEKRLLDIHHPVHVLHFDGHGAFARHCPECDKYWHPQHVHCGDCKRSLAGVSPRGYLAFETDAGEISYIDTKKLLDCVLPSQIRLVVLSSCESARVRGADLLLAGVGPGLILGGVPAVIAMQFPILDRDAVRFFDEFYSALAQGKSLPNAVSRGRSKLDGPARWAPVLYLRSRGDQIHLCGRK